MKIRWIFARCKKPLIRKTSEKNVFSPTKYVNYRQIYVNYKQSSMFLVSLTWLVLSKKMVRIFSTILLFNLFESKINVVMTKNGKKANIFPLSSFKINKKQMYVYTASTLLLLSSLDLSPLKNTKSGLLKQCSLTDSHTKTNL